MSSKVAQELNELRQKHLAKNQRDKLKDAASPLTTPEEAQAFLRTMRQQQKDFSSIKDHKPPSNLSADGMDAWYLQQKQRELELRKRRQEAEALLRGYRMSAYPRSGSCNGFGSPMSGISETLEDPDCHSVHVGSTPNRRHTIHAGDMPSHLLPEGRILTKEFEREGEESFDAKNTSNSYYCASPSVRETRDKFESEEKKDEEIRRAPRRIHDRNLAETPLPPDEKLGQNVYLPETIWRDFISSEPGAKFPPECGRYHIYASYACPGSHRALIVRALKGLQDVLSVTIVHPTWRHTNLEDPEDKHRGWVFGDPNGEAFTNTIGRGGPFPPVYEGNEPDPILDAYSIRQLYEHANDTSGKYTIPLIWDKKTHTIVNNESSDIAYMLNSCFNDFARNPELDLYTEDDEEGMEKLNEVSEWLYPLMIHGVYRCGFAKSQAAYDQAIAELTEAFDKADAILQRQRYLTGDALTDADIRLFVTLLRFDEVYAFYFKANTRLVMLTPSLLNFCREIYQLNGVAPTCNMDHIKAHFYGSHAEWNKYSVIPRGLGFIELLDMPHDREQLTEEQYAEDGMHYEDFVQYEEDKPYDGAHHGSEESRQSNPLEDACV